MKEWRKKAHKNLYNKACIYLDKLRETEIAQRWIGLRW